MGHGGNRTFEDLELWPSKPELLDWLSTNLEWGVPGFPDGCGCFPGRNDRSDLWKIIWSYSHQLSPTENIFSKSKYRTQIYYIAIELENAITFQSHPWPQPQQPPPPPPPPPQQQQQPQVVFFHINYNFILVNFFSHSQSWKHWVHSYNNFYLWIIRDISRQEYSSLDCSMQTCRQYLVLGNSKV